MFEIAFPLRMFIWFIWDFIHIQCVRFYSYKQILITPIVGALARIIIAYPSGQTHAVTYLL
jgi:hypothetical protein